VTGEGQAVDIRPFMATFPMGVTVVTAFGEDGRPHGMTCSSLCSVTLDPPTLLVCVRRGSPTLAAMHWRQSFAVNLLADQARSTAELFSSPVLRRFEQVRWSADAASAGGPHLTDDAHLVADCRLAGDRLVGTHDVVFGLVTRVTRLREPRPLLYGMRRYASWAACGDEAPDGGRFARGHLPASLPFVFPGPGAFVTYLLRES
jgi:flavin reductase (DIM6/NTAB) family NADH-FMN oxidoreductase RutF